MGNILLGKKAIAVWVALAAIIGTGSFAIAIQPVSDWKIHLQDVDGKIHTNVPVAASRAFSPLPVEWSEDSEVTSLTSTNSDAIVGSNIATKQKMVFNFVLDVSDDATATLTVNNRSEDTQIFLIKAGSTSNVMLDMESGTATIHGLTGHNEWLASAGTGSKTFTMEVSTTDAGFYPIVVELLRVG